MSKCIARQNTNIFKKCTKNTLKDNKYCAIHEKNEINDYNVPLYSDKVVYHAIKMFNNKNDDLTIMKYCLYKYNKNYIGTKKVIYKLFQELQDSMIYYLNNISNIILIQKLYRGKYVRNINKIKGVDYIIYNKSQIVNDNDFYTCDNIATIKYDNIFAYKDIDNNKEEYIYVFDIRSIILLIKNDNKNPYNRVKMNECVINNIMYLHNYLTEKNVDLNFEVYELTDAQKLTQEVLVIFQKIDKFYYTDINWFLDLTIYKMKKFYNLLEDIWNWRAELTHEKKYQIIKNNNIFQDINIVNNSINKLTIQTIILKDINILVNTSESHEYNGLGALYILVALSYVSEGCSTSMPWLYETLF